MNPDDTDRRPKPPEASAARGDAALAEARALADVAVEKMTEVAVLMARLKLLLERDDAES